MRNAELRERVERLERERACIWTLNSGVFGILLASSHEFAEFLRKQERVAVIAGVIVLVLFLFLLGTIRGVGEKISNSQETLARAQLVQQVGESAAEKRLREWRERTQQRTY